jgi:beta-glucosidase
MRAVITLHHFTLPRDAAAAGGWADERLIDRFARYSAECVRRLDRPGALWATLNEPSVLSLMGYVSGEWPPGGGGMLQGWRALAHQLRAHAAAREAIRAAAPEARVGIVLNAPLLEAGGARTLLDKAAAAAQDWCFLGCVVHALRTGLLAPPLLSKRARVPELAGSLDWLGVNYYGRYQVLFDPRAPAFGRHDQRGSIRSEHADWGQIFPQGLTRQLMRLSELKIPVYVTENGVCDSADLLRPRYLLDHVAAVHDAIRLGADVRGYFHWSLIDNFEWAEGYSAKFGLLEIDRNTQRRTPRESAALYARICRANRVDI